MRKYLITGDLHLTDDPLDRYRFGIFPWISEQAEKHSVDEIVILGDITDKKDNHSSELVNEICDNLYRISDGVELSLLMGNHDCINPANPFLRFLNMVEGITFYTEPTKVVHAEEMVWFLPHTRDPKEDWKELDFVSDSPSYIFLHETFMGAASSNGHKLEGLPTSFFKKTKATCVSGDIHVPQKVGRIHYAGSPYRIRYGDDFTPRVLLVEDHQFTDLHFPCLSKHLLYVDSAEELRDHVQRGVVRAGDQVKIRIMLSRAEFVDWETRRNEVKNACKELELHVGGVELEMVADDNAPTEADPEEKKQAGTTQRGSDTEQIFDTCCAEWGVPVGTKKAGHAILRNNLNTLSENQETASEIQEGVRSARRRKTDIDGGDSAIPEQRETSVRRTRRARAADGVPVRKANPDAGSKPKRRKSRR